MATEAATTNGQSRGSGTKVAAFTTSPTPRHSAAAEALPGSLGSLRCAVSRHGQGRRGWQVAVSSATDWPRRGSARPVQRSAAELGCRPWRRRVSKARPGATNRQRQDPATRDVDLPCQPVGRAHRQVVVELGLGRGEGAGGGPPPPPRAGGGDGSQGGGEEVGGGGRRRRAPRVARRERSGVGGLVLLFGRGRQS